jgi:hypothetical protein
LTVAGIDVGSRADLTALVKLDGRKVATLAQLPRDVPLDEQAAVLAPLLADAELVCVDATGLGLGLAEALERRGVRVLHVTITAGKAVKRNGQRITVGKLWLVQRLAVAIGSRAIDVPTTDLGRALVAQLAAMTVRITERGRLKMEAPGTAADDLALALALALLADDVLKLTDGRPVPLAS